MNAFTELLTPWLADYFLLSTCLLAVVLLLCRRIGQPAQRLAIARPTLAALFLLTGLCAVPGWSLVHLMTTEVTAPVSQGMSDIRPAPPIKQPTTQLIPTPNFETPPSSPTPTTDAISVPSAKRLYWAAWLVGAYVCGCLMTIAWQASGGVLARRLIRDAVPAPPQLQTLLTEIGEDAKRLPSLLVSDRIQTPAALGVLHPTVLLPAHWVNPPPRSTGEARLSEEYRGEGLRERQLRPILAHEWAHIRNGDLATLAAVRVLMILLWPQPFYWLIRRQIRRDQETLADAVASNATSRADYAEQLIAWARVVTAPGAGTPRLASSVGLWESASQLKQRVAMLLDEKLTVLRTCSRRWRIGSAISLAIVAVGLSLVTLTPADTLVAEVKSEQDEETEESPVVGLGSWALVETSPVLEPGIIGEPSAPADVTIASPPADEEKQEQEGRIQVWAITPPADGDGGETVATETAAEPSVPAISDQEWHKLVVPLYRRLHETAQPNMIHGICIDENGQPLAGVLVQVYSRRVDGSEDSADPLLTTKSDEKGEFRFTDVFDIAKEFSEGIPEGNFQPRNAKILTIVGRGDGRVPGYGSNFASSIARHGESLVWLMQSAETLRGRVTDGQGEPVAGAQVTAGLIAMLGGAHGINTATTGADGEYVIDDLAVFDAAEERRKMAATRKADPKLAAARSSYGNPRVSLIVKHTKFAAKRATIEHIPGNVDVQLVLGSVIEGRVKPREGDAASMSIAGSVVRLQRVLPEPKSGDGPDAYSFQIEKTTVNERGRFRFESLPAGKYDLTADVEGWVTQGVENVEVTVGETATAPDILLTQGGRMRVQLVDDETGEPIRFDKPTKGYINPQQRPQRAAIFMFRDNVVEFSTEGTCEIQLAAGRYAFHINIPMADRSYMGSVMPDDRDGWQTYELVDGESLELSTRVRVHKQPPLGSLQVSRSPANDEESEDDKAETAFVLETPPEEAEE